MIITHALFLVLLVLSGSLGAEEETPNCHVYYAKVLNANDSVDNLKKDIEVEWSMTNQCSRTPYKVLNCFSYFIEREVCIDSDDVKDMYIRDLRRNNLFLN